MMISPYGIRLGESGKVEVVPVIRIRVRSSRRKEVPGIFVVDSGATTTLLPSTDAESLNLNLTSGSKVLVRGVVGQLLGYRHKVTLVIENAVLRNVPVIFAERPDVPRVLGRENIFPRFGIFFDEKKQRIALLDSKLERKSIDAVFDEN